MGMQYVQATGEFYISGKYIETGYAGAPDYINDPEAQCLVNRGPLPRGRYKMTSIGRHKKLTHVIRLTPQPGTDMCGRDGMLIHGGKYDGSLTASKGCIILTTETRIKIREQIKLGNDILEVK